MPGYEGARYGLVWICDSGIRGQETFDFFLTATSALDADTLCVRLVVKPDTLTDLTNQMTEKVGLVHGLPYVADRQGFAATLEQVRLHANIMLMHDEENFGQNKRHYVVHLNFKDFLSSWLKMGYF